MCTYQTQETSMTDEYRHNAQDSDKERGGPGHYHHDGVYLVHSDTNQVRDLFTAVVHFMGENSHGEHG